MVKRRAGNKRAGSGTLIFLAFMVLAFLFIIALFQWFGSFLTRANKIFNQGNCARLLAESAINEVALEFASQVNKFPSPPDGDWAGFFDDPDSEQTVERTPAETNILASSSVEEGGFGLSNIDIKVVVIRLKERKLTDVDSRGLVQYECKIKIGSYGRKITRAHEYYRYNVVPPAQLGAYTFIATNWGYLRTRWRAYLWYLLQHKATRIASVKTIEAMYGPKAQIAEGGITYAQKVTSKIGGSVTDANGNTVSGTGPVIELLSDQLDRLAGGTYTVKSDVLNGGESPPSMFNIEYFLAMSKADATPLKTIASGVGQELQILPGKINDFKFRDGCQDLTSFLASEENSASGGSLPDILADLEAKFDSQIGPFVETDCQQFWYKNPQGGAGFQSPIYVEGSGTELNSNDLQFHVPQLPSIQEIKAVYTGGGSTGGNTGNTGGTGELKFPSINVPPSDAQFSPNVPPGTGFFHMDPADFGLDPAEMASKYPNGGTRTPLSQNPSESSRIQNAYQSSGGSSFSGDVTQYNEFRDAWNSKTEIFTKVMADPSVSMADDPANNTGQLKHFQQNIKFASVDTSSKTGFNGVEYNLNDHKSIGYISSKMNRHRACYRFLNPESFALYAARQSMGSQEPVFKLSGLSFIEGKGANGELATVKLPAKYLGMGMIATDGNIEAPQGCVKKDPNSCGNLILSADGDITIGGDVNASVMANGSIKTNGQPTITGNLIVEDTKYDPDGGVLKILANGEALNASDFVNSSANKITKFKIKWDDKLCKDDGSYKMLVISPGRVAQSSERLTFTEELVQ